MVRVVTQELGADLSIKREALAAARRWTRLR